MKTARLIAHLALLLALAAPAAAQENYGPRTIQYPAQPYASLAPVTGSPIASIQEINGNVRVFNTGGSNGPGLAKFFPADAATVISNENGKLVVSVRAKCVLGYAVAAGGAFDFQIIELDPAVSPVTPPPSPQPTPAPTPGPGPAPSPTPIPTPGPPSPPPLVYAASVIVAVVHDPKTDSSAVATELADVNFWSALVNSGPVENVTLYPDPATVASLKKCFPTAAVPFAVVYDATKNPPVAIQARDFTTNADLQQWVAQVTSKPPSSNRGPRR